MKTNYWYSILIIAMLGLYGVNGAVSITADADGNVIAANGQRFNLAFEYQELAECTTNVSPFRVLDTAIVGLNDGNIIAVGKYVCQTDAATPYLGNADQVLFNAVSVGAVTTDLCSTLIKTGIDTTYYPIQITDNGTNVINVNLDYGSGVNVGGLWTAIPGTANGSTGAVEYGQNSNWINIVGFSNFKQCDFDVTIPGDGDAAYILTESSQKIYLCYNIQAYTVYDGTNTPVGSGAGKVVKFSELQAAINTCNPSPTRHVLVDILGQSCSTTTEPIECTSSSKFMVKDADSGAYTYACKTADDEYGVDDINYPTTNGDVTTDTSGVAGTDYIDIFGTDPGAEDSANYALEIKKGDAAIRVTGVDIVGFNTTPIDDSIYIVNIPLYGPSTTDTTKLVRSRVFRAQIALNTAYDTTTATITDIGIPAAAPTNGIKQGNVWYTVTTGV